MSVSIPAKKNFFPSLQHSKISGLHYDFALIYSIILLIETKTGICYSAPSDGYFSVNGIKVRCLFFAFVRTIDLTCSLLGKGSQ